MLQKVNVCTSSRSCDLRIELEVVFYSSFFLPYSIQNFSEPNGLTSLFSQKLIADTPSAHTAYCIGGG